MKTDQHVVEIGQGVRRLSLFTGVSILPKRPSVSRKSWPTKASFCVPGADGYQDVHAATTGVDELRGGFYECRRP
jgi:hypothetical protein